MAANIGPNPSVHSVVPHNRRESSHMSRSQELNYVEALKTHQMTRLEHIRNEATKLRLYLDGLRNDVLKLEAQRIMNGKEDSEWALKVSKLREENRSLRIECHCMSMEVDLYASGQMPLGVTDENFYKNVPPGPVLRPIASTSQLPPTPTPRPYPVQQMPPQRQPPSYEESILYPPPRFSSINSASSSDILHQVPPAPRPVWLSPTVQQTARPVSPLAGHTFQGPPQLPPRPSSASPRTPIASTSSTPSPLATGLNRPVVNQSNEEGNKWTCEKCTVENHPALPFCEVCEMPRNGCLGTSNRT